MALTIATRESPLALWQAEFVKSQLQQAHPGLEIKLLGMTTQGDRVLDSPLAKVGGKGLFVKELEIAMLQGSADIAVHSMKDVPMAFPDGLRLEIICQREDPHDAFVSNRYDSLDELPQGAKVGSSSLRRQCQVRAHRPDLQIIDLRGNVNTRLRKLDEGNYDAIILAVAGLKRLGFEGRIKQALPTLISLPAVGQGAVGIECRSDDEATRSLLAPLGHFETTLSVRAERAMNEALEGGCQVPIAGFAELVDGVLGLRGLVGHPEGHPIFRAEASCSLEEGRELELAAMLGKKVGEALLAQGAGEILKAVYQDGLS